MARKQSAVMDRVQRVIEAGKMTASEASRKYDISRSAISQADWYKQYRAHLLAEKNAAATHSRWLEAEVQEAIDDGSPAVPHDEAMRQVRAAIKAA